MIDRTVEEACSSSTLDPVGLNNPHLALHEGGAKDSAEGSHLDKAYKVIAGIFLDKDTKDVAGNIPEGTEEVVACLASIPALPSRCHTLPPFSCSYLIAILQHMALCHLASLLQKVAPS